MALAYRVDAQAQDIAGVLERMDAIDSATPERDGVSAFNRLYRRVTEEVAGEVAAGATFEDEAFLSQLDVRFANHFFTAYAADMRGEPVPKAWRPLFQARGKPDTAPIQFALAGMNAHINFDLPVAVIDACTELTLEPAPDTPHHRDYFRVNAVLGHVQDRIKDWFALGLIAEIDERCGKLDDALSIWSIAKARGLAWEHAELLWALRDNPNLQAAYERSLAGMVSFAGRGLLL